MMERAAYRDAEAEARTELLHVGDHLYHLLMATRQVYQHSFIDSGLPVNDKTLGLLPAHAMARISEVFREKERSGVRFSNVSDRPRNLLLRADAVEMKAIDWFREHPEETVRFTPFRSPQGAEYFLYARPIRVEPYCLRCHGEKASAPPSIRERYDAGYGYGVGELRGILSIKLPAAHLAERVGARYWQRFAFHLTALGATLAVLLLLLRHTVHEPLSRLAAALSTFGERGEVRLPGRLPGAEFQAVGAAFEGMARSIREQQRALARREAEVRLLLDCSGEGIYAVDRDGVCVRCNPRAAELLGYSDPALLLGRPSHTLFHHHHADGTEFSPDDCPTAEVIRDGRPLRVDDEVFWRADGTPLPVEYLIRPIVEEGEIVGAVVSFHDTTERLRVEQRLREAKEAAEAGNRAKGEFLNMVSHEIRTPLNAVIGMADLLVESPLDAEQRRYVELSQRAGEVLLVLIDEILDFSRVESGEQALELAPLELAALVEGALAVVSPQGREKGLLMTLEIAPGLPRRVVGDARRLRQILVNLLDNAVKFTERGAVWLNVERPKSGGEGALRFAVGDTGIGIAAEQRVLVFQPFTQADGYVTRRHGGCGLGLALVDRLVSRMGGEIDLESTPGEGTRVAFTVRLPEAPETSA
ncbi:hypothetical protein JCM17961_22500 [Endothiovibrio diazotrophicus]